jgi:hypothetical protein
MAALKIKDIYDIRTPSGGAFSLKRAAVVAKPYLLSEGCRDFLLAAFAFRYAAMSNCVRGGC